MGGGASTDQHGNNAQELSTLFHKSEAEIVRLMMPLYYTTDPVTDADLENAKLVWTMIIDDTAPEYVKFKETPEGANISSCVMYFYDSFYTRLFDIHPVSD